VTEPHAEPVPGEPHAEPVPGEPSRAGRRKRHAAAVRVVVVVLVVAAGFSVYRVVGTAGSSPTGTSARPVASTSASGSSAGAASGSSGSGSASRTRMWPNRTGPVAAPLAPDGTFVTPGGSTRTVASLRGQPTLLWFVAGGCASCAASIPAVAAHLRQLRSDGVRVVTLGLFGDFSAGKAGAAQLVAFGRAAAGEHVQRSGWEWGMASQGLSMAYDPSGTPDTYALVGPDGHIRYRNTAPVSTMAQLLSAAGHVGRRAGGDVTAAATKTLASQPCC